MPKDEGAGPGQNAAAPVIVAITASAARTASLESLLGRVPPSSDAAFVIVLQHREALDEDRLLQAARQGGHEPARIEDGMPIEAGRLYLAAPDMIVTVAEGGFHAHPADQAPGLRGVIDSFLVSLAHGDGARAIGVLLAGTDGDGTLGAQELKAAGGMVLAEVTDEDLAHSDSPAALADAVLPVEEIAGRLTALVGQAAADPAPALRLDSPAAREALAAIAALLRQKTGHDFHGYKAGTFLRRIQRRMQALLLDDLAGYIDLLRGSPDEAQSLFNDLLIGVTEFFRDGREWELLEREVIPRLFQGKGPNEALRLWAVGCATGEEAYSLAILLAEHRAALDNPPPVQIFASDLDGRALAVGRAGRYAGSIAAQMSPERLARWFVREGDTYCVAKELREMCIFSQHSLIKDAPFSRLDFVSCRNLLIYLDAELQEKVIPLFHFALNPGGFLFLGNSENASRHTSLFAPVEPRSRIFRRLEAAGRVLPDFPFTSVDRRLLTRSAPRAPGETAPGSRELTRWAEHVMERYSPAFVVIDADHTVLHFSGPTGRYMAPASGAASLNLLQLIHPGLRLQLRAALSRAAEAQERIEVSGIEIGTNGHRLGLDLIVEPRSGLSDTGPDLVVIFRDRGTPADPAADGGPMDSAGSEQFQRLEEELRLTRDRLQATIEELESTNEELKSSNEEYQSLNEELQSANEELETSKEELQSVNEELTTVNGELAHHVQELGRANSDLKNFLEATQIATLFLDNDLRVTNFTPAIADVFHLVESDEGRPIGHIKARVAYDELTEDARRVLRTLVPVEREIGNPQTGAHYIARVLPYRSTDNFIAGVVVTFVDVTARRQAEAALRASEHRYRYLFEAMEEGFVVADVIFDGDGRAIDVAFIEANPAVERLTGRTIAGTRLTDVDLEFEPYWYEIYGRVACGGAPERLERNAGSLGRWYDFTLFKLYPENEASRRVAVLFQDVTARRIAEDALRTSEARFRALATAGAVSSYRMSPDWRLMHQLDSHDFLAPTADPTSGWRDRYILPEDREMVDAAIDEAIRTRSIFELEHRVALADGGVGWVSSRAIPMLDDKGEIIEWFGTGSDITARKQAEAALRETEARQAFLLALGDAMRAQHGPQAMIETAACLLGEHLGASRIMFAEFDETRGIADVFHGWFADGARPFPAVMRLEEYDGPVMDDLRADRTVRIDDTGDPALARADLAAIAELGVRALLSVPLVIGGRLVVNLSVHQHAVRRWTDAEVALVREAAERLWADLVRARAETSLRESEERFRQFADASQDLLWVRDAADLQWEYLSPAFEAIYGIPREAALSGDTMANWLEMIHPEDRATALGNIERVRAGEQVTFEYRIHRPDGEVRWLRNTDFPMHDASGRVVRIGGIGHDATDLKAVEAALAAAERRQRALIEGIPQLVWRAGDGGHWTWASPQWCNHTGQSLEASLGLGWLEALHPDDREPALRFWIEAERTGRLEMEGRIFHAASQDYCWFQTRATPVRDREGRIAEWLGTSTDIDEMRVLQERQAVLVAELQHRTRNLMIVVRALVERIGRASTDLADFRTRFGDRLKALARVQGLLSRLEGDGRVTFAELVGAELAALGADMDRVTLSGPREVRLRSSTVQTLALALHELATNAVKHGALGQPQGRLAVTWSLEPGTDGPPWLHIDWRESGVAMPDGASTLPGHGQGRELIERALPYQLDARTSYVLGPGGVHCTISIPVSASTPHPEGSA